MPDDPDAPNRRSIRDDSDELLRKLNEIRALEAEKRTYPMSSPPFHALAERIEDESRDIFRLAAREREHGDDLGGRQDVSIDEESATE